MPQSNLFTKALTSDERTIRLPGTDHPVQVRRSTRARRFTLKIDEAKRNAILTVPAGASIDDAVAFAGRHVGWLDKRMAAIPSPVPFTDGAIFPYRGNDHEIRYVLGSKRRGVVWVETFDAAGTRPLIHVSGEPCHAPRRLTDWLKREARKDLSAKVAWHAERLDLKHKKLAVRDQTTRWGSCSSNGTLSFSWRLILAPDFVLDYVAAHEVAHLAEMNHGPRFWRLVYQTMPRTDEARAWLKANGRELHRYGATPEC